MNLDEFQCKCGNCLTVKPDSKLKVIVDTVESYYNQSVHISSGFRCPEHNASVGGAAGSYHTRGQAADIAVQGVMHETLYEWLDAVFPEQFGIGLYDTHVHVDSRRYKSRWDKRSEKTFKG